MPIDTQFPPGDSGYQITSPGNSKVVTSSDAAPASPWIGDWELTQSHGIVRQLVTLVGSTSAIPGTFTFQYSDDGATATISEARPITTFATLRDFDLKNAGKYFRVQWEPDGAMGAETVTITTTYDTQFSGQFVRLAAQVLEEQNVAMGAQFAFLKAFVAETGLSINIRANRGEAILTASFDTEVALGNIQNYSSAVKFGRVKNIDAADSAVDIWAYADDGLSSRADTKTFPSVAATIYLCSSSASDTAVDVTVAYIDSTGAAATATDVTLTGQTPVSIGATGLDVNGIRVTGSTAAVGIIYASITNAFTAGVPDDPADILAVAPVGYQQSQLSHFTVPLAKTLVMKELLLTVSRSSGAAGSADVTLRIKEFGGVSRVRREYFPTQAVPIDRGVTNLVVPARSQIVWRVDDVSDADTNISCIWAYELIDDA